MKCVLDTNIVIRLLHGGSTTERLPMTRIREVLRQRRPQKLSVRDTAPTVTSQTVVMMSLPLFEERRNADDRRCVLSKVGRSTPRLRRISQSTSRIRCAPGFLALPISFKMMARAS